MVLSAAGGALPLMLPVFRLGIGGRIGDGRQYISWISLDDVARVVEYLLHEDSIHGAVNVVAPNPVTNREFTQTLAQVLSRPAWLALPSFAARIAFGRMADEMLLSSIKAVPARLAETGFKFSFPTLDGALRTALGKQTP